MRDRLMSSYGAVSIRQEYGYQSPAPVCRTCRHCQRAAYPCAEARNDPPDYYCTLPGMRFAVEPEASCRMWEANGD